MLQSLLSAVSAWSTVTIKLGLPFIDNFTILAAVSNMKLST